MLQVRNITKRYATADFEQVALDDVSLDFGRQEFVAVLGPSGSGKTTFLNVIGGLDRYDSGDLIIDGRSTKDFQDWEWDAYRNKSVGFVFQTYNLITHLTVLENVEMAMTLSGASSAERRAKAIEALERVGLREHMRKLPNQLSGGQMQRVAIARALTNDPDIILADEPTGALDTTTSTQVLELIKEIATDKLVVMVTHNSELADQYADRVVRFVDGKVVSDTRPEGATVEPGGYKLKKTSMGFFTALKLSGRNIATKKWRTTLTALASSMGIIGIALILSLSYGFRDEVDRFQNEALSEFPIIVSPTSMSLDKDTMEELRGELQSGLTENREYSDAEEVTLYDPTEKTVAHTNIITDEYVEYVKKADPNVVNSIGYMRMVGMNVLRSVDGAVTPVALAVGTSSELDLSSGMNMGSITSMRGIGLSTYPETLSGDAVPYLQKDYDLLAGSYPASDTDLVLVVDNENRVAYSVLEHLGFKVGGVETVPFEEIVGTELRLIDNDDFYVQTPLGNYVPGNDYEAMYGAPDSITLTVSGIVRLKPDVLRGLVGNGIAYSDTLVDRICERADDSAIVKAQREASNNVMTMEPLDETAKKMMLAYLGGDSLPFMVFLYPSDFESKNALLSYLDEYNVGRDDADMVVYTDLASSISEMSGGIMDGITLVLVAFAGISLVVSLIMVGIITYISVLERTREIGVLRALGARKKDITRVFTAETFLIGLASGLLGLAIAYPLIIPMNTIIEDTSSLVNVAELPLHYAAALLALSLVLTLIGGAIPARIAAKKDPVEALRSE
jgi:putative ABC transport system permease protein